MQKTINTVMPFIYCYTEYSIIDNSPVNQGWCKIGYTEQEAEKRVYQQTHTAGLKANIEWVSNAVYEGSTDCFNDHDFHTFLRLRNIPNVDGTELFKIDPDEAKKLLNEFKERKAVTTVLREYKLREEQTKAVQSTLDYAEEHKSGEFLWNAKPRFGKTLSFYDFCFKKDAKKILIITGRPTIANSWYDDYMKFFGKESGYFFISETDELKGKDGVITWDDFNKITRENPNIDYKFIYFVSLQNLKGSVYFGDGPYKKLKEIKLIDWDVLGIDEAHEGVDTYKTEIAFDNIKRKFTLHLTGTAFKALVKNKFNNDAIYSWTYVDEQEMKENWNGDGSNPYLELPKLNMKSYRIQNLLAEDIARESKADGDVEFGFKLNVLFECNGNGVFKHEAAVDKFLDVISSDARYPFSPDYGDVLTHTFWLLYRVNSAKALEKKLRVHPVFKDYEVIIAAGDGKKEDFDDVYENKKSFGKVREAIKNYKTNGKIGTITLSVGQLTTGITIPEWTGVMMLSEQSSPERYMQTIFRVQNPWFYYDNGEYHRKENAYVFDFNQEKALTMMEQFANDLSQDTAGGKGDFEKRKSNVSRLVNCFPIFGEGDDGQITELSPDSILTIPRKLKSDEVVRSKFMSNELFVNIENIFRAPKEIQNILRKMPAASKPDRGVNITPETGSELHLNDNNEVEIPTEVIEKKADEVVSPAKKEETKKNTVDAINRVGVGKAKSGDATAFKTEKQKVTEAFTTTVTKDVLTGLKATYGKTVTDSVEKDIKKTISSGAEAIINKCYQQNEIDKLEAEEAITEQFGPATTQEEREVLAELIKEKHDELDATLSKKVVETATVFIETTIKEATNKVETKKVTKEKDEHEDDMRNHLRGFARTIPSFIMAYGDDPECIAECGPLCLANFDKFVPKDVFKEVTSITIGEFKMLRDGGNYTDANGEIQEYEGKVFDTIVFNDSIKKFLELKKKLANYFDESQNGDIFDYIPLQKTNQKFTPKGTVTEMIDYLEEHNIGCFDDETKTFIDPYMKSGLFPAEIIKRLYRSERMKMLYPDDKERLKHIFEHQVYGLAPTTIIHKIALNFLFGSELTRGISTNNFVMLDAQPYAENGTLEEKLKEIFNFK